MRRLGRQQGHLDSRASIPIRHRRPRGADTPLDRVGAVAGKGRRHAAARARASQHEAVRRPARRLPHVDEAARDDAAASHRLPRARRRRRGIPSLRVLAGTMVGWHSAAASGERTQPRARRRHRPTDGSAYARPTSSRRTSVGNRRRPLRARPHSRLDRPSGRNRQSGGSGASSAWSESRSSTCAGRCRP